MSFGKLLTALLTLGLVTLLKPSWPKSAFQKQMPNEKGVRKSMLSCMLAFCMSSHMAQGLGLHGLRCQS